MRCILPFCKVPLIFVASFGIVLNNSYDAECLYFDVLLERKYDLISRENTGP